MSDWKEVRVIEDFGKYCTVDIDGRIVKAFKLDMEQLEKIRKESIEKLAKGMTKLMVKSLISRLDKIVSCNLLLKDYLHTAESLTEVLNTYYDTVGPPNVLHYYIKNIDPEIYGKGQTFLKESHSLLETMKKVLIHMDLLEEENTNG